MECLVRATSDEFIQTLGVVLTKIVADVPPEYGPITCFNSMNAPPISDYLIRIARYVNCSNECFVLALVYIDRIMKLHRFSVSVLNIHRLLITSVMLAAKFSDDVYYSNSFYAQVGGIKVAEINLLEAQFLMLIKYHLFVNAKDYETCRKGVESSSTKIYSQFMPYTPGYVSNAQYVAAKHYGATPGDAYITINANDGYVKNGNINGSNANAKHPKNARAAGNRVNAFKPRENRKVKGNKANGAPGEGLNALPLSACIAKPPSCAVSTTDSASSSSSSVIDGNVNPTFNTNLNRIMNKINNIDLCNLKDRYLLYQYGLDCPYSRTDSSVTISTSASFEGDSAQAVACNYAATASAPGSYVKYAPNVAPVNHNLRMLGLNPNVVPPPNLITATCIPPVMVNQPVSVVVDDGPIKRFDECQAFVNALETRYSDTVSRRCSNYRPYKMLKNHW